MEPINCWALLEALTCRELPLKMAVTFAKKSWGGLYFSENWNQLIAGRYWNH
jgi:hypothetical protein